MPKTYIIGHQKPDTDSVVSALALEFLYQTKTCFGYENPQAVITNPVNNETQYLLDKFKIKTPQIITAQEIQEADQIVLVDHNEESQRLPNLNPDQISEIVDHHKINLNLSKPIYLNIKPWGCTVSIIYFMMQQYANEPVQPSKQLASLMLAAILSDTVGFKSSTTTSRDQKMADELAKIAEIDDIEAFALEILKAKSNTDDLNPQQLVKNDYKIFDFGQKVLIGQLETVEQEKLIKEKKAALISAMQTIKEEEKVDLIILAITDVLKVNTKLLLADEPSVQVAQQAFASTAADHILDIGPKLSRKKDIVPMIEKQLKG